ncbi:MAG: protein kinase [Pseudomonadota bacterium]
MQIELPGYKIKSTLGKGGMATVYLAVQESFERDVALKVMSPDLLADASFGERFLREAKIVSRLVHPNIVSVYDVGIHNGYYFLSMEYIPGKDLTQKRLDLSLLDRLRVIKEIARALDFAGKKGYVHRDVKPENIMLHDEDGRAVLMDFGIAKPSDTASGMTQVGTAIGTPHYMSPEQAKGLAVDTRADLYSLGVVLFLMVTGRVPYDGESAVVVGIMHISEDIPCLPPYLEVFQSIIDKAMAKNPERRYQTGAEFIAALDAIPVLALTAIINASGAESTAEGLAGSALPRPSKSHERKAKGATTSEFVPQNTLVARSEDRIVRHAPQVPQKTSKSGAWLVVVLLLAMGAIGYSFQKDIKQVLHNYSASNSEPASIDSSAPISMVQPETPLKSELAAEPEQLTSAAESTANTQSNSPQPSVTQTFIEQTKNLRESVNQDWQLAPELATIFHKSLSSKNDSERQLAQAGLDELQYFYANLIRSAQQEKAMDRAQEYANSALVVFAKDEKIAALQDALTTLHLVNTAKEESQKIAVQAQEQEQQQQQQQKQKELEQLKQKQQKQKNLEQDLLNIARAQQAAGKFIVPVDDNALKTYRELLAQNAQHPAAREGVNAVENAIVKQINQLLSEEKFNDASAQLVSARESFPQSKTLLGLSIDLERAISDKQPAVSRLLVTSNEVDQLTQQEPSIAAERIIYIGFEYRNFKGDASVLQAILYDGSRSLEIAQVPVIINGASGSKFFRIEQPVAGFADGGYHIDLLFKQEPLISTKFSVKK